MLPIIVDVFRSELVTSLARDYPGLAKRYEDALLALHTNAIAPLQASGLPLVRRQAAWNAVMEFEDSLGMIFIALCEVEPPDEYEKERLAEHGLEVEPMHAGTSTQDPTSEVLIVNGPTARDLAETAGISLDTFQRVRSLAEIKVKERGGAAGKRRYPPHEVDRLIEAASSGNFIERRGMVEKWAKWATKGATKPQARN